MQYWKWTFAVDAQYLLYVVWYAILLTLIIICFIQLVSSLVHNLGPAAKLLPAVVARTFNHNTTHLFLLRFLHQRLGCTSEV